MMNSQIENGTAPQSPPPLDWKALADRLNTIGYLTNEDEGLRGQTLTRSAGSLEDVLRQHGYVGGPLEVHSWGEPDAATQAAYDVSRFADPLDVQRAYEDQWRDRINRRADDWIGRLSSLRLQIENWTANSQIPNLTIVDRPGVPMNEEIMRRYKVPARNMPSFEVRLNDRPVMRMQPKGLWVIGANGRIDLITKVAAPILVDRSEPLSNQPDWRMFSGKERRNGTPFTENVYVDLLKEAAN